MCVCLCVCVFVEVERAKRATPVISIDALIGVHAATLLIGSAFAAEMILECCGCSRLQLLLDVALRTACAVHEDTILISC